MQINIRSYRNVDEEAVIKLWKDCGLVVSWNDPQRDIQRKMKVQGDLFLVGCLNDEIISTVMAGYEGHRGWINYLAVLPAYRRCGVGRQMMEAAESLLFSFGCPKINLQVRRSNRGVIKFYQDIGYKEDEVLSMGKRLVSDE